MKKQLTLFALGLSCLLFVGPVLAHAQTAGSAGLNCDPQTGQCSYVPLEPVPGTQETGATSFASLLSSLFKILLSLGALIAVARMVAGGIMYMTSEATETKGKAKEWISSSIYGLLLLAGSWLILNTINPNLLNFSLTVGQPNGSAASGDTGGSSSGNSASSAQNYSASSNVGQVWAQGLGGTLRDTKSAGAVRVVQTTDLTRSDIVTANNTFNSECTAGGAGTVITKTSGNNAQTVFVCKSTK